MMTALKIPGPIITGELDIMDKIASATNAILVSRNRPIYVQDKSTFTSDEKQPSVKEPRVLHLTPYRFFFSFGAELLEREFWNVNDLITTSIINRIMPDDQTYLLIADEPIRIRKQWVDENSCALPCLSYHYLNVEATLYAAELPRDKLCIA